MMTSTYNPAHHDDDENDSETIGVDLYSINESSNPTLNNKEPRILCLDMDASTLLVGAITFVGDSSRGILFPGKFFQCFKIYFYFLYFSSFIQFM